MSEKFIYKKIKNGNEFHYVWGWGNWWDANNISYNNTYSWLTSNTVQWAIDEIVSDLPFSSEWDWDINHAPSKNAIYGVIWNIETLLSNL